MPANITLDFDIDIDRLVRAMDTPDDVGTVLRVHLELERALDHVIGKVLPKAEKAGWRYPSQKMNFLLAMGIPDFRMKPAQIINSIRNGVAHKEQQERLDEAEVADLFRAVNAVVGNRITEDFEFVRNRSGRVTSKSYREMSVREKFCLLGFVAISTIASLTSELQLKVNRT
jgi:hypothetical protein